jgi:membrane protease YdiL (CAAX protease family)
VRATVLFAAYLAMALIVGALLAYPIYLALSPAVDEPMYRYVIRCAMLIALIGLVFFLRYLGLDDKRALGYGLARRQFLAKVLVGLAVGVIIMLPLVLTLTALDVRVVEPGWSFSWFGLTGLVVEGLISGLAVAFIEETFFRGAMFGAIERESGLWPAAIITSALYAAVHFIDTSFDLPARQLEWYSGVVVLSHMFEQFTHPAFIVDSFLALFAVGMFLALVRTITGHIALCVGLHAGWVLTIKVTKDVTEADHSTAYSFLVGHYDNVIGYLAFILIVALTLGYYVWTLRGRTRVERGS